MGYREQFIEIYNREIKREGADKLLTYLEGSDFFTAPASTKFHAACQEGLAMHSLNVYYRLKELIANEKSLWAADVSEESIAICGLLHDVCKAETYKIDYKNVKQPDGSWERRPFYTVDEELPYGHGEKSVYIINGYMRLTREEAISINWHMGGFDERAKSYGAVMANAYSRFPLAVMLHIADLAAAYFDEERVTGH